MLAGAIDLLVTSSTRIPLHIPIKLGARGRLFCWRILIGLLPELKTQRQINVLAGSGCTHRFSRFCATSFPLCHPPNRCLVGLLHQKAFVGFCLSQNHVSKHLWVTLPWLFKSSCAADLALWPCLHGVKSAHVTCGAPHVTDVDRASKTLLRLSCNSAILKHSGLSICNELVGQK